MQVVNVPMFAAWLCFHFSTNVNHLYAGLCLAGLSGGLLEAPVLTYVAEVTTPRMRGLLAASGSFCSIFGVFTQFVLGTFLTWRTIAALSLAAPIVSFIALFFVPESPHWLIQKNRLVEAKQSLAWFRGWTTPDAVHHEYCAIYNSVMKGSMSAEPKCSSKRFAPFGRRSFWAPYAIIITCFFIGHFSGMTTLQTYAVQIFHTLKAPIDKYYATMLLGICELMGTLLCIILVHYTGKRPLVLASTLGCGLCFFGCATYAYFLNAIPGESISNIVSNTSSINAKPLHSIIELNETESYYNMLVAVEAALAAAEEVESPIYGEDNDQNDKSFDYFNDTMMMAEATDRYEQEDEDMFRMYDTTDENNSTVMMYALPLVREGDPSSSEVVEVEEAEQGRTLFWLHDGNATEAGEGSDDAAYDSMLTSDDAAKSSIPSNLPENFLIPVSKEAENRFLWVPLTLLLGSAVLSHAGIRLIPWMLIGELYPTNVRGMASGLSGGTGYFFGFLANKMFLKLLAAFTLPGTFWMYASVSLCGTVLLYFILPETEGRTLIDIEEHFSGGPKLAESKKETATRNQLTVTGNGDDDTYGHFRMSSSLAAPPATVTTSQPSEQLPMAAPRKMPTLLITNQDTSSRVNNDDHQQRQPPSPPAAAVAATGALSSSSSPSMVVPIGNTLATSIRTPLPAQPLLLPLPLSTFPPRQLPPSVSPIVERAELPPNNGTIVEGSSNITSPIAGIVIPDNDVRNGMRASRKTGAEINRENNSHNVKAFERSVQERGGEAWLRKIRDHPQQQQQHQQQSRRNQSSGAALGMKKTSVGGGGQRRK